MEETKVEAVMETPTEEKAAAPAPEVGTKELTEAVDLLLDTGLALKSALADGKVGLEDAVLLMRLVPKVGPALEGIGKIPAELKDLSAEEAEALAAHVMAKLTVENKKARDLIEASLKLAVAAVSLVRAIAE